jgi:cellulose synthase/poly-beta-1,6-N-acetylglucosamine synthase-like glycosyltransferase
MQTIIVVLLSAAAVVIGAIVLYLYFLAAVYFLVRRHRIPVSAPRKRIVVTIPAHNEEAVVAKSVQSVLGVDYPKQLFDVYVVADNCTDRTREVAEASGARCLVRNDRLRQGKGYALRYAFDHLAQGNYDVFIVIDADTVVSPNLLSSFNNRLNIGQEVIQCRNEFKDADATPMSYLLYVGKRIENRLLWEAKSLLGFSVLLQGNGMCFSSRIIRSYPWDAFSVTEDAEYSFSLIREGLRIHYAHETEVLSLPAARHTQTTKQRLRWASGSSRLFRKFFFSAAFHTIKTRHVSSLDAAFSVVLNSKIALIVISLLTLIVSLILFFLREHHGSRFLVIWAGCIFLLMFLYFVIGVGVSKLTLKRVRLLFLSPLSLLRLCVVSFFGFAGLRQGRWVRTPRDTNRRDVPF